MQPSSSYPSKTLCVWTRATPTDQATKNPGRSPEAPESIIPRSTPSLAAKRDTLGFSKLAALPNELKVAIFSKLELYSLTNFLKALEFEPHLAHRPSGKTLRALGYNAIASFSTPPLCSPYLKWAKYDIFCILPLKWIIKKYPECHFQGIKCLSVDAVALSKFKDHYYKHFSSVSHLKLHTCHIARSIKDNNASVAAATTFPSWPDPQKIQVLELETYQELKNLAGIEAFSYLQTLSFFGCNLSSTDVSALKDVERLKTLILTDDTLSKLSDLKGIEGLERLEYLRIISCYRLRSIEGIEALKNLEGVMLHGVGDSLDGVASLAGLKKLRTLALSGLSTVAGEFPEGLEQLAGLRLKCKELSSLKLIRHLKHLERLNLDDCRSLLDFSVLKDLPRLKWLSLGNCRWTDPQLLEDLLARGIEIRYLETLDFSLSLNPNYKPTSPSKT